MKKLFLVAVLAASLVACKETTTTETVKTDSAITTKMPVAIDGDYMMSDNKIMVMKGGEWVVVTEPMTLPNGIIVMANGEVKTSDGTTITLANGERINAEGVVIDKDGVVVTQKSMLQKAGDGIENGLNKAGEGINTGIQKTGEGINKAGEAIETGATKAKEGIETGAKKTGEAIKKGAEKTGDAIKKGANKVGDGVKNIGQ